MSAEVPPTPELVDIERELADQLCRRIEMAAELHDVAQHALRIADIATSEVMAETNLGNIPFSLLVSVHPSSEAYVSYDDEIVDENPTDFVATELRSIGPRGTEFYNRKTGHWLKMKGREFEVIPLFAEVVEVVTDE